MMRLCSHVQGNRVAEWVSHSVGLPQYVKAFRENSITVCSISKIPAALCPCDALCIVGLHTSIE